MSLRRICMPKGLLHLYKIPHQCTRGLASQKPVFNIHTHSQLSYNVQYDVTYYYFDIAIRLAASYKQTDHRHLPLLCPVVIQILQNIPTLKGLQKTESVFSTCPYCAIFVRVDNQATIGMTLEFQYVKKWGQVGYDTGMNIMDLSDWLLIVQYKANQQAWMF